MKSTLYVILVAVIIFLAIGLWAENFSLKCELEAYRVSEIDPWAVEAARYYGLMERKK